MRRTQLPPLLSLPLLLVSVACGAPAEEIGTEPRALRTSKISGGCSASREEILASTSPARRVVIERGFTWLDDQVPYSQSATHEGYRTDCSGFVSMCWELDRSNTTADFITGGPQASLLASYDELVPGDALVRRTGGSGHVVLFLGWEPGQTGACVLEQASSASDMQFRVRSLSGLEGEGYKPLRADALANDVGAPEPTIDPPETTEPVGEEICIPKSARELCTAAREASNVQCGLIADGCGGRVSCDGVLGCAEGEACGVKMKNQCDKIAPEPGDDAEDEASTQPQSDVGDVAEEPDDDKDDDKGASKKRLTTKRTKLSTGCAAAAGSDSSSGGPAVGLALGMAILLRFRKRRRE